MLTNLPTLIQGTQGQAVALLQRLLVIYGYEKYLKLNSVDGVFGVETHNAVEAFQDDHYLDKDGQVGYYTWKAMAYPFDNPNQ
ncbi:peptidoglycan-binding protein [Phormidium tenue FACHB-886]|nr:peptidoglycan-binding protein [Phormidium tenue FACHB-886]